MDIILYILIIVTIVQVFLTVRKSKQISHIGELTQVNELMGYIDRRELRLTDDLGKNAFMIACSNHFYTKKGEYGFEDVVKNGIASGVNIDAQNLSDGKTALMYALNKGNEEIVKQLLDAGADVDVRDATGRLALFDSIRSHIFYEEIVSKTININHQDNYGVSALMLAGYLMDDEIIDDLIERRIDGSLETISGETAFDIANKYISHHIHVAIQTPQEGEFGKSRNITTSEDVLNAQKHNHKVRENLRKIECYVNGEAYLEKKFKRPLIKTGKAN